MGYLPKCGCGGAPAMLVTSDGCHVQCQACRRRTGLRRRQAQAAGEWEEMCRAPLVEAPEVGSTPMQEEMQACLLK